MRFTSCAAPSRFCRLTTLVVPYGATAVALPLEGWLAHRRARRPRDAALTAALVRAKNTGAAR